jgi:hypothetical protein
MQCYLKRQRLRQPPNLTRYTMYMYTTHSNGATEGPGALATTSKPGSKQPTDLSQQNLIHHLRPESILAMAAACSRHVRNHCDIPLDLEDNKPVPGKASTMVAQCSIYT